METRNIKDFLPLYLGCEMYLPSSRSQSLHGKIVGILKTYPFDIWQIEMPDGAIVDTEEGLWNDDFGHTSPILRPLSDLTEEEKEYVTYRGDFTTPEQFRFLLSKHFDLFGLIESALAIDKSTLKP